MDTNTQALDEVRRIASRWLTDLNTDATDAMRNIAGVLIGGPSSITLMPQVNVGMDWELVEQTTSRLADSMEEACFETSMALRPGLLERLEFAISEATNKPGTWREGLVAGGFISAADGSSLGKLNGRRDAWLAVAAVNALPELIERVRGAELAARAADQRVDALERQWDREVLGLNNEGDPIGGDPAGGMKNDLERMRAEVARLRAENEEMRGLAIEGANTIIDIKTQETAAARDVLAERRRQVDIEWRRPDGDDAYLKGELADAAGCYATHAHDAAEDEVPGFWPWEAEWWKPSSPRRNLVKAGALILAEIERLDRADAKAEARIDVIGQNGNDGEHYAPQLSLDEVLAAAAPDEVAEAMAADDGWTEWKGHARPMEPFARVDLKLRDGSRLLGVKAGSYAWKWVHGHGDVDVIAYRLPRD